MSGTDSSIRRARLLDMLFPLLAAGAGAAIVSPAFAVPASVAAAGLAMAVRWFAGGEPEPQLIGQEEPRLEDAESSDVELLSALPLPLLLIEESGRIRFATPEAERLLARALSGQPVPAVFRSPSVLSAVDEAISGGKEDTFSFRIRHPRDRTLTASVRPLTGPGPLRVAMILSDETGKTRVDATRSDFVANASHELRTPLAAISGIVETLRGSARDDPEAQERFLAIVAKQTDRMTRLVNDLLSLSRIELDENVAPTEVQEMSGVLAEVIGAMRPLADEKGIALTATVPDDLPPVLGVRDELSQVFVNLIDNALRFAKTAVTVEASAVNGMLGIAVSDDGPGIEREHIPRLTERFYRVNPASSREKGGTGLGLAIVKHILNRHKGRLDIESAVGRGSRFSARLPVHAARAAAS